MNRKSVLKNKTLIVGCGSLGATIANKCSAEHKNVMIVDTDAKSFERLSDRFAGYTYVGDVSDLSILEEAQITSAKEIIVVTGDDNTNLFIAHIARKIYDVPEIYVRLSDPNSEVLLKGMNIHAIYPLELSYDKFNLMRGGRK